MAGRACSQPQRYAYSRKRYKDSEHGRQSAHSKNSRWFVSISLGAQVDLQQALVYAQQAVAMARRLDNPELTCHQPPGNDLCPPGSQDTCNNAWSHATESLQLAEAAHAKELSGSTHTGGACIALLELGDIPATDVAIDAHARAAEETAGTIRYFHLNKRFQPRGVFMQDSFADSQPTLGQQAVPIGEWVANGKRLWSFWLADVYLTPRAGPPQQTLTRRALLRPATHGSWRLAPRTWR